MLLAAPVAAAISVEAAALLVQCDHLGALGIISDSDLKVVEEAGDFVTAIDEKLKAAAHSRSAPVHAEVRQSLEWPRRCCGAFSFLRCYLMVFGFGRSFPSVIRMLTCPVEVTDAVIGGS